MSCALVVLVCIVMFALDTSALRRYLGTYRPAAKAIFESGQNLERERAELEQQRFEWLRAPSEVGKSKTRPARRCAPAKICGPSAEHEQIKTRGHAPVKRFRRAGLPSSARLDLPFVLRATDGVWRAVLGALIADLYGQLPFFKGYLQRRPALIEQLLEELAGQLPPLSPKDASALSPDADFVIYLKPRDPELALLFCWMVEGNGAVPSLREYISMLSWRSNAKPRIQLQLAPFALRRALLGKGFSDAFDLRYRECIVENPHPKPPLQDSDWRLPAKRALTSRQCRELFCATLKEQGLEPGDLPLFKHLDFGTHCRSTGDFVVGVQRLKRCRVIHPRQRG